MNMRDHLTTVTRQIDEAHLSESTTGKYMVAFYSLELQTWNVRFFPDREAAYIAWEQWSKTQGIKGDAFFGPVDEAKHAKR